MEINKNRIIYNMMKNFIEKHFYNYYNEAKEYDNCFHITIYNKKNEDSFIWLEFDMGNSELIVGLEVYHIHYGKQYGREISEGLNRFLDFFTTKIRRTDYYKGDICFKSVYEEKGKAGTYKCFGTNSILFLYPIWKKTTNKVIEYSELIEDENIKMELEIIREWINNIGLQCM